MGKLEKWENGTKGDINGLQWFSKTQHRLGTVQQGSQTRHWKRDPLLRSDLIFFAAIKSGRMVPFTT